MTPEELEAKMATHTQAPASDEKPEEGRPALGNRLSASAKAIIGMSLAKLKPPTPEELERRQATYRANEERQAQRAREHEEQKRRETEERASQRRALLEDLRARVQPKLLGAITKNPSWSALLLGPTGCGKTSAARILSMTAPHIKSSARTYCEWDDLMPARIVWIRATELATAERRHGLGEGAPPEIESARKADALVVDDVGHERDTAALFDVLDYRYANNKPVIVTSGLTKAELNSHISAALVRRIVEQHAGFPVLMVNCHEVST